jgi:hypothetical protein
MSITKKHIIVFIAFYDLNIIKKSFECLENLDSDIFIVENKSPYSKDIEEYFKDKNIIGYIQFNENVANNCIPLFNKDYSSLLNEYEYITYTDGDLYVIDANDMFNEIFDSFKYGDIMVSSSEAWLGNCYLDENNNLIPVESRSDFTDYLNEMKENNKEFGCKPSIMNKTSCHFFITLKKQDLRHIYKMERYSDGAIYSLVVHNLKRKWYKTNKNIVYHIQWDSYYDGNEYYEWKKKVNATIWNGDRYSDYKIIK